MYLPGTNGSFQRDCSEQTAQRIDEEVKEILDRAYTEAKEILHEHRDQLELVANELVKSETLDAQTFQRLIGRKLPPEERPGPTLAAAPETLGKT
jgi:cell division protease FtsH